MSAEDRYCFETFQVFIKSVDTIIRQPSCIASYLVDTVQISRPEVGWIVFIKVTVTYLFHGFFQ